MTVVTCFDTLTPDALPDGVEFFIDYYGETEVRAQVLARFPTAFGISFTFSPADAGGLDCWVCDCEQRGYQPDQAAYWAHQRVLMGKRPCCFVEVSMKPELETALAAYDLEFGRDVDCWLSWWGQPAVIPQGIVQTPWGPVGTGVGNIGIQYLNNGNSYDESVLDLAWVQTLMPKPPPPPEDLMAEPVFMKSVNGTYVLGPKGLVLLSAEGVATVSANKSVVFDDPEAHVINAIGIEPAAP